MPAELARKKAVLTSSLARMGPVLVAYSGGVDSAFLASIAHETLGERALMVTAVSASLARRELDEARSLARGRGWDHLIVATHEVAREEYARNAPDRCYWCKTELLEVLGPLAQKRAATIVLGTNVDDLSDHRPGLQAARERSTRAPLVEAGLTKAEIRELSRAAGLPTADKPSSPCLASRFAYGVRVTPEGLRRIDAAEEFLRGVGFTELRVRDHGDLARIELPPADIERAGAMRSQIVERFNELGFRYVTLDLQGFRSGALNEVLTAPVIASTE